MDNWLLIFNQVSLSIFLLLVVAGLARMGMRAYRLRKARLPLGPILKRDLGLFGILAVVFGIGGTIARVLGIPLSTNPFWVVPVSVAAIVATGYWVWVEYHLEAPHKIENWKTRKWTI